MKSGWQYVQTNGATEKMAPMTLIDNVKMSEDGVSLKDVMPSNLNMLINGDFQVWQRGEVFSGLGSGQYFADRWRMNCYGVVYADRRLINGRYAVQFDIGTDKTWCGISQRIEDKANYHSGRTVCLTIYSPNPETIQSALIQTSNGNNWIENVVRSADRMTGTISIAPFSDGWLNLWIYFDVSKQYPNLYAVKLEEGSIATPLSPRTCAEELAMCQRYYLPVNNWCGVNFIYGWGIIEEISTPATMRINPRVIYSGDPLQVYDISGWHDVTVSSAAAETNNVRITYAGYNPTTYGVFIRRGIIALDAET